MDGIDDDRTTQRRADFAHFTTLSDEEKFSFMIEHIATTNQGVINRLDEAFEAIHIQGANLEQATKQSTVGYNLLFQARKDLNNTVLRLETLPDSALSVGATPPTNASTGGGGRRTKTATPNEFKGESDAVDGFLADLWLLWQSDPIAYTSDAQKIGCALSYVKGGTAQVWKENAVKAMKDGTGYKTWSEFESDFVVSFKGGAQVEIAQRRMEVLRMEVLRQGGDSAVSYFAQLESLNKTAGFNETTLIMLVKRGVHQNIVEQVYRMVDMPTDYAGWKAAVLKQDGAYRAWRTFKNSQNSASGNPTPPRENKGNPTPTANPRNPTFSQSVGWKGPTFRQTDRAAGRNLTTVGVLVNAARPQRPQPPPILDQCQWRSTETRHRATLNSAATSVASMGTSSATVRSPPPDPTARGSSASLTKNPRPPRQRVSRVNRHLSPFPYTPVRNPTTDISLYVPE
ncbi:Retrotrans-gag domain-containing protein [Mycena kentingensis (nom. inval.)]|nr:Retrotrans-gag domain-containing protein [Mycena kentingensis (nom. inval.)]